MKFDKRLCKISFLQALGLVVYIAIVSIIFWKGNTWFPKMNLYLGPVLMLTLYAVSALISALIVGGYPFILFWEKKKPKEAIKLLAYTAGWLVGFVVLGLSIVFFLK